MTLIFLSNPCTFPPFFSRTTPSLIPHTHHTPTLGIHCSLPISLNPISSNALLNPLKASTQPKYTYPDPIPEFAESETQKFKGELLRKLSNNKDMGGDLNEVVIVCAEIFSNFLHTEYGGPGTLLVEPFTDMLIALKEKKLPGAPEAARAALLWAQNYLDKDWQVWISKTKTISSGGKI